MIGFDLNASLKSLIDSSNQIVIFTGAGVSTESGIPDFRSPGGIWSKVQPIDFREFVSSEQARRETWRRKILLEHEIANAAPNRGHRAIAQLVKQGKCNTVITQNIDGLHQRSGIAAQHIIELHGNGTYASCLDCHKHYELAPILANFEDNQTPPVCNQCGGLVKPATISFGQSMPVAELERAQSAAENCDLFIAMGSSLVVYPAAALPLIAKQNGAQLVILNREPTDLDEFADLILYSEIGQTLAQVCHSR